MRSEEESEDDPSLDEGVNSGVLDESLPLPLPALLLGVSLLVLLPDLPDADREREWPRCILAEEEEEEGAFAK